MKVPFVIGISGKAHSGKDYTASLIRDAYPELVVKKISFADPIREMLSCIVDVKGIYESNTKEERIDGIGVSLRELMQSLGTDWGRHMVDKDLWTNVVRNKILSGATSADIVVIPDVRFPNERDTIFSLGGIVLEIKVSDTNKHVKSKFDNHESEWGNLIEDNPNYIVVENDFTDKFVISVNEVLKNHKGRIYA